MNLFSFILISEVIKHRALRDNFHEVKSLRNVIKIKGLLGTTLKEAFEK